jgi:glycine dehydrogenase
MNFKYRHIGITNDSKQKMLSQLGYSNINELSNHALAKDIQHELLPFDGMSEQEFEKHIAKLGEKNTPTLNVIGRGFFPTYCPAVIRRNILENPSWYTQYTPYQAEISQGRLEALFNFQS